MPKKLRDKLKIKTGDTLKIWIKGEKIILEKADFWGRLFGCAKGLYNPDEAELELDRGEVFEEDTS